MTAAVRIPALADLDEERVCERCDVCMPVTLCEQAEDGVWLCRECADKEHREREAAEYSGPVHEAEGWK